MLKIGTKLGDIATVIKEGVYVATQGPLIALGFGKG